MTTLCWPVDSHPYVIKLQINYTTRQETRRCQQAHTRKVFCAISAYMCVLLMCYNPPAMAQHYCSTDTNRQHDIALIAKCNAFYRSSETSFVDLVVWPPTGRNAVLDPCNDKVAALSWDGGESRQIISKSSKNMECDAGPVLEPIRLGKLCGRGMIRACVPCTRILCIIYAIESALETIQARGHTG